MTWRGGGMALLGLVSLWLGVSTAAEPGAQSDLANPGVIHAPVVAPLLPSPHERGVNESLQRPVPPAASGTPHPTASGSANPATTGNVPEAATMGNKLTKPATQPAGPCMVWGDWERFRQQFLSPEGRVIDHGAGITTSEGQSYALFFSLVANDQERFKKILAWTQDNLAGGDLTARLPAWQWGKKPDGTWGVMDDNAASDADLWIAYTLAEAAILWKVPRYGAMAELLAARILREEAAALPGLGLMLLPGPKGFHAKPDEWRLNPSYTPPQLLRRMANLYPHAGWEQIVLSAAKMLSASAPRGFSPDWVLYREQAGFLPDPDTRGIGSYNAIRVYLWVGMMDPKDPERARLLKVFAPFGQQVSTLGVPVLEEPAFATEDGRGAGPRGFSAAVLPFLEALNLRQAVHQQQLRLTALSSTEEDIPRYYDAVLELFGRGWMDKQYRFTPNGALVTHWSCEKPSSSGR